MSNPFEGQVAASYVEHSDTLRGLVRHELASHQFIRHLPAGVERVLDLGGGQGQQSIRLARKGYHVTLADHSEEMLIAASAALALEPEEVRNRVELIECSIEGAAEQFEEGSFDAALSHGVVCYLPESASTIKTLSSLVRKGGSVSLATANADSFALRPGLQGDYVGALDLFGKERAIDDYLGVEIRGDKINDLLSLFASNALVNLTWYGIRFFTDHLPDDVVPKEGLEDLLEAERKAGCTDPYRQLGRLIHVIGRK
jgi:S-adenosylmethionine-dependent methyltransferase